MPVPQTNTLKTGLLLILKVCAALFISFFVFDGLAAAIPSSVLSALKAFASDDRPTFWHITVSVTLSLAALFYAGKALRIPAAWRALTSSAPAWFHVLCKLTSIQSAACFAFFYAMMVPCMLYSDPKDAFDQHIALLWLHFVILLALPIGTAYYLWKRLRPFSLSKPEWAQLKQFSRSKPGLRCILLWMFLIAKTFFVTFISLLIFAFIFAFQLHLWPVLNEAVAQSGWARALYCGIALPISFLSFFVMAKRMNIPLIPFLQTLSGAGFIVDFCLMAVITLGGGLIAVSILPALILMAAPA